MFKLQEIFTHLIDTIGWPIHYEAFIKGTSADYRVMVKLNREIFSTLQYQLARYKTQEDLKEATLEYWDIGYLFIHLAF